MLAMAQDLVRHKWYANARLLTAVQSHPAAAEDQQLRDLLHHILLANRFWLMQFLEKPFVHEEESRAPETITQIVALFRETQSEELAWLSRLSEPDLDRTLDTPFHSGQIFSVAQALMQVCMHSQGHRAQCAARLRLLGGVPPPLDFILWLKTRTPPEWPTPK
jgi:uncharacterized damage-inducible protein DinB